MRHEIIDETRGATSVRVGLDAYLDALRECVSAYGITSRRRVLSDVGRHLGIKSEEALAEVRRALDALEATGEVQVGPKGRIACGPLLIARLPGDEALLLGALPARDLSAAVGDGLLVREGPPRRIARSDELVRALTRLGAREIEATTWARLDRTPPADDVFVESLSARSRRADVVGTLERLDALHDGAWQCYTPTASTRSHGLGWKTQAMTGPSLVRWRDGRADWRHGWALQELWPRVLYVPRDEARRACFALDRLAGGAVPTTVSHDGESVRFRIEGMLPAAEYRYVNAAARVVEREARVTAYVLPVAAWPALSTTLRSRLGLHLGEGLINLSGTNDS